MPPSWSKQRRGKQQLITAVSKLMLTVSLWNIFCISSYSFRVNYWFLNLEIVANSNSCRNISIFYLISWNFAFKRGNYSSAETVCVSTVNTKHQGMYLFTWVRIFMYYVKGRLVSVKFVNNSWCIWIWGKNNNLEAVMFLHQIFVDNSLLISQVVSKLQSLTNILLLFRNGKIYI